MLFKSLLTSISRPLARFIHIGEPLCGIDKRDQRIGHLPKTDTVEGERLALVDSTKVIQYIGPDLMDRLFNNVKFKDIPILVIKCSRNNTKITLTGGKGDVLCIKSAGTEGYKNCRKGTTVAAQAVANRVVTFAKDHEITMARLVFDGLGPGRGAAYKVFEISGVNIISLSDRTEAIEPWKMRPRKVKRL